MPKQCDRKLHINELDKNLKELERDGLECSREFTEILDLAQSLSNCCYLYQRLPVSKCDGWKEIFWSFPDGRWNVWISYIFSIFVEN